MNDCDDRLRQSGEDMNMKSTHLNNNHKKFKRLQ